MSALHDWYRGKYGLRTILPGSPDVHAARGFPTDDGIHWWTLCSIDYTDMTGVQTAPPRQDAITCPTCARLTDTTKGDPG